MSKVWHFPLSNHTQSGGANGSGLDQFSTDPFNHLAREVLQNSLDARKKDAIGPVRVEFHSFKTPILDIPGIESLGGYILDMHNEYKNNTSLGVENRKIASNSVQCINGKTVQWLRVSDFNTTGLWGGVNEADQETPWFAFVHGVGRNQKEENSGGSKGLGKNALFVNSLIRTMLISTYAFNKKTLEEEEASTGIAKLLSITDRSDNSANPDWTYGVGYCVEDDDDSKKHNSSSKEILEIDPLFDRRASGYGTDLFLPFLATEEEWRTTIAYEALLSFMPSIYDGELVVNITSDGPESDIVIDKYTIQNVINLFGMKSQKRRTLSALYNVMKSSMTQVVVYDKKDGFDMRLLLLQSNQDGLDKVFAYRFPTKMKIKSYSERAAVSYTGILLVEGEEICKRLRSIEDATHSTWAISRYKNTEYEKNQIGEAIETVENFVAEQCALLGTDGMADYVGLDIDGWSGKKEEDISTMSPQEQEETGLPSDEIVFETKREPSRTARKPRKKKSNRIDSNGGAENAVPEIGELTPDGDVIAETPEGTNAGKHGPYHSGNNEEKAVTAEGEKELFIRRRVATLKSKLPAINPKEGKFDLVFATEKTCHDANIELVKSGVEGENEAVSIIEASAEGINVAVVNNKIHVDKLEKRKEYRIHITIGEKRNYIWEVNIDAED